MDYVIFFANAGIPQSGLSPTIITYIKVSDGSAVAPAPSISELSGGFYKFTATPTESRVACIDGGGSLDNVDRYKVVMVTPHDGDLDAPITSIIAAMPGVGAITWTYTLTRSDNGDPIADADVWVTTDSDGTNVVASGKTDQNGVVTFYLDAGVVYVWRQKSGYTFVNPDMEVVTP